ncbi:hypothetical protein HPB50_006613 [Hyalomma asiaticum]|uniref:Uncharacterized protein n=1 Tax=Hyalomma asiaticum TaxID=266040 RepID=A0ACB7S741_HYAAI|nr:hypothetical protein HPB50_006613 [Hyalomma asiaticum]
MAFMMPVVRNDYDIYNRSRRSSPEHSNAGSPLGSTSLSTSPNVHGSGEDVRKMYRTHEHLDALGPHRPRSGSLTSIKKFHHLLVDTLKRAAHHNSHASVATGAPHCSSGCAISGQTKEQADCDDEQRPVKEEKSK